MAFLNQSNLPEFFSSLKVYLKIIHRILPNPTIPEAGLPMRVCLSLVSRWPACLPV
jgi:hypothetical protein